LGTKAAPTDIGGEKMAESPPLGERPVAGNVEAPQTEGWALWPIGLHVAKEEKKKKEEEERRRLEGEEENKEKAEGENKGASPSPGNLEEEVPASSQL
jgi:hypothetical protein